MLRFKHCLQSKSKNWDPITKLNCEKVQYSIFYSDRISFEKILYIGIVCHSVTWKSPL